MHLHFQCQECQECKQTYFGTVTFYGTELPTQQQHLWAHLPENSDTIQSFNYHIEDTTITLTDVCQSFECLAIDTKGQFCKKNDQVTTSDGQTNQLLVTKVVELCKTADFIKPGDKNSGNGFGNGGDKEAINTGKSAFLLTYKS